MVQKNKANIAFQTAEFRAVGVINTGRQLMIADFYFLLT
jgi:hypothetical protein